jgi:hypothetical protein
MHTTEPTEPTEPTRTYDDVIRPLMDHPTALFHMQAHINLALLRRGRTLRFAAINQRIDALAENLIARRCLPTATELVLLAADIKNLEAHDPNRR